MRVCPGRLRPVPAGGTGLHRTRAEWLVIHREKLSEETLDALTDCCPTQADRCGEEQQVEEIMATVLRDKPFYDRSGGGITLSGGEPFMNPELAHALFKASHDRYPHRRRNLPSRAVALYRAVITVRRSVPRRPEACRRRCFQAVDGRFG